VVNGDLSLASNFTLAAGDPTINLYNNNSTASTLSGQGTFTNADTVIIREDVIDVSFFNQGVLLAYETSGGSAFNGAFGNEATGVFRIPVIGSSGVTVANGFINTGLIDLTQQSTATAYTSTLTVTAGTLINSGTIQSSVGNRTGPRVLAADVTNNGTIDPGGAGAVQSLRINGNVTLGVNGFVNADIQGPTAGTGHDELVVSGNLALDGNLQVALGGGFTPTLGQLFTFITTTGTLSGDFANVTTDWVAIPGGSNVVLEYASP
jgi:hypothetical protein